MPSVLRATCGAGGEEEPCLMDAATEAQTLIKLAVVTAVEQ